LSTSALNPIEVGQLTKPGLLNLLILGTATVVSLSCLVLASRTESWWVVAAAALVFSYSNNTLFSLLHEAVHLNLHSNRKINDLAGQFAAMMFPTGFVFQRAFHLGHHQRNRTDVEMFEMYYQGDNRWLKYGQLYTVLLGFYWTAAPLAGLLYLFFPGLLNSKVLRSDHPDIQHMSADAMLSGLKSVPKRRCYLELLLTLVFQVFLFTNLGVHFLPWLLCYWFFAINWGALQYADHAWSRRDIRNGAWNLKVNKLVHHIFLAYHHHKAHHQYPQVPWIHLHKFVDFKEERPTHLSVWLKMWKGPTLASEPSPNPLDPGFCDLLINGDNQEVLTVSKNATDLEYRTL